MMILHTRTGTKEGAAVVEENDEVPESLASWEGRCSE